MFEKTTVSPLTPRKKKIKLARKLWKTMPLKFRRNGVHIFIFFCQASKKENICVRDICTSLKAPFPLIYTRGNRLFLLLFLGRPSSFPCAHSNPASLFPATNFLHLRSKKRSGRDGEKLLFTLGVGSHPVPLEAEDRGGGEESESEIWKAIPRG